MDKNEILGKNGKKRTDWLKTPISKYAKIISDHYLSIIAKKGIIQNDTDSENNIPTIQAIQPEIKIPTIQESKDNNTIKPDIQAIGPESQEISSLMRAPELEQVTITTPSANDTIFVTKYAANSVVSNIEDKRIQKSLKEKFEQFDSEMEGLMTMEENHRNKAMELEIQADNIFGANSKFTQLKLREKAKKEKNIANGIRKVIMIKSKESAVQKAA